MRRSPDWICPQCSRPNRECLLIAEPKQASTSSSSSPDEIAIVKESPDLHSDPVAESEAEDMHVNKDEAKEDGERRRETGDTSCGPGVTHAHNAAASGVQQDSDSNLSPAEGRLSPAASLQTTAMTTVRAATTSSSSSSRSSFGMLRKRMADDTFGVALDAMISVLVALAAAIAIRKFVF